MIDTVELAPRYRISRVIRGGWQQHAAADLDPEREAIHLHDFADSGILAFETADIYRGLDRALSRMLEERRRRAQPVPRIHTRITLPNVVETGVASARHRLGLDVLDLVQLQSWRLDEGRLIEAASRLQQLADGGLVSNLGLMNVDADTVDLVLAAGVRPLTVQVQCSLLDRRALGALSSYAVDHDLRILAYGALAGGFLTGRWLGRPDPGMKPTIGVSFHPEYRAVIELFGGWALYQRLLCVLGAIAARHGVSLCSISLRWVLDQVAVAAALVGASTPARLRDWHDSFAVALTSVDRAAIAEVLADASGPRGPVGGLERASDGPLARAIAASLQA